MSLQTAPSPYGSPHTPIASAKRTRILGKGVTKTSPTQTTSRPLNSPVKENRRPQAEAPSSSTDPIFSPSLNYEATGVDLYHGNPSHIHEPHVSYEEEYSGPTNHYEYEWEQDEEEFNPFLFMKTLPSYHTVCAHNKICLPPSRFPGKHTLALDLDETLVHCTVEPIPNPDHVFSVNFNDTSYEVYVRKRPYLDYFLEAVSKIFEVVVFTASQQVYADRLLDLIDSNRTLVHHRLFRESCLHVHGNFLKDLNVLGRCMAHTVLVDNSPYAYGYQLDNGIPIESWFDDDNDSELLKLSNFLKKLNRCSDVRPIIRDHFKTHKLVERAGMYKRRTGQTPSSSP